MNNNGNCIVGQSGGPTVAINASLSGVLQAVMENGYYDKVYGMVNGIEGLLQGKFMDLTAKFNDKEAVAKLANTPSMYLGSCRYKLPNDENSIAYEELFSFFKKHDIRTIFYIGGNDSMDTVLKLSGYAKKHGHNINVLGIPKTIDNDLPITDHTPGFGSAAKFVATSVLEIAHDTYIYNIPSVTIVEIMGRNAGWLTASSILARTEYSPAPDLIYLPEVAFDKDKFIEDVKRIQKVRKNIVIAVSEGIKDKDGKYISAAGGKIDAFGHQQLCGAGKALESLISAEIGCKVRSIELNVLQRAASHIASKTDLDEAAQISRYAVSLGIEGETGKMICYKRLSNNPYLIDTFAYDISAIANEEKRVPLEWITEEGNNLTQEAVDYLFPLIQGETTVSYANGLPSYCDISHLHGGTL